VVSAENVQSIASHRRLACYYLRAALSRHRQVAVEWLPSQRQRWRTSAQRGKTRVNACGARAFIEAREARSPALRLFAAAAAACRHAAIAVSAATWQETRGGAACMRQEAKEGAVTQSEWYV